MAETIVSPGILSIENDQSFITQQPIQAGAAIIGPTPRGPVGIPTMCSTYNEYKNKFGSTFISGSQTYTYFTSIAAYNYFQGAGNKGLLITRVVSGSTDTDWAPATSSILTSAALTSASLSVDLNYISSSLASVGSQSLNINGITLFYTSSEFAPENTSDTIFISTSSFDASTIEEYVAYTSALFNSISSIALYSSSLQFINSSYDSPSLLLTSTNPNGETGNSYYVVSGSTTTYFSGGTNTTAFVLETLSEGIIMNSDGPSGSNGTLLSGSMDNVRWQVTNRNILDGTFSLVIRRGNDNSIQNSILETFSPLSLDPNSPNYIEKIIGNQYQAIQQDPITFEYYVQMLGNYRTISNYVRVKQVLTPTINYLDNNGVAQPSFINLIPALAGMITGGGFGDGKGSNIPTGIAGKYYETITDTNIQGLNPSDYIPSISLLANKDSFKYNLLIAPGLIADPTSSPLSNSAVNQMIDVVTTRGDAMVITDIAKFGENINAVVANVISKDNSYSSTYWPWLKTIDPDYSTQVWTPASTLMLRVYAQNDNIAHPWFAPAGVSRGLLPTVITTERILTQGNRDFLYQNNINPIATFPGSGIVVFGQKTLLKQNTSLNRINVRRLLIELKNYISQIADNFVFEQNTESTRENFLSMVNPYLNTVQIQQGLQSFQVVIDSTNNTPTTIDNNQLIGQIYIQPTKTIEFIILDFNIQPTGATFS